MDRDHDPKYVSCSHHYIAELSILGCPMIDISEGSNFSSNDQHKPDWWVYRAHDQISIHLFLRIWHRTTFFMFC